MQKIKRNLPLVAMIGILFATGVAFANMFEKQLNIGVPVALGEDGEDTEDKEDEEDEREDEEDNDRDEEKDEEDEKDSEDEDENEEQEKNRTRAYTQTRTQTQENDSEEDEDAREAEKDSAEDANEIAKDIKELNKDISKVEMRISVLAANGFFVESFNTALAEVKGLAAEAQAQAVSNFKGAERMMETAEHKLERLEKLVKMSLKDDDEDEESTEEAIEEIQELKRDLAKVEARISVASAAGIDVSSYSTIIADVKALLAQAEEKLAAGNFVEAESIAELASKKLDRMDDAVEDFDEDEEEDDDVAKEYKNEVAQFIHNLKAIGEIEGGIGEQVRVVAQAQNDSENEVDDSIKEIEDRHGFVEFLVGPKYGSIAQIKAVMAENEARIKVLTDLSGQITDPAVKTVFQDQITILSQQNANLQKFVADTESGISLFGWLVKMFS